MKGQKAFGACSYMKWKLSDGQFGTRFVAAKARVIPLKELTIPRLELQAAVLVSRLGKSILQESRFNFLSECAIYQTAASSWPGSREKHVASSLSCLAESLKFSLILHPQIGRTVPHCPTLLMI